MSKVIALVSFAGQVSMTKGEVMEISDESIVRDLLISKYVKKVKERKEKEK